MIVDTIFMYIFFLKLILSYFQQYITDRIHRSTIAKSSILKHILEKLCINNPHTKIMGE